MYGVWWLNEKKVANRGFTISFTVPAEIGLNIFHLHVAFVEQRRLVGPLSWVFFPRRQWLHVTDPFMVLKGQTNKPRNLTQKTFQKIVDDIIGWVLMWRRAKVALAYWCNRCFLWCLISIWQRKTVGFKFYNKIPKYKNWTYRNVRFDSSFSIWKIAPYGQKLFWFLALFYTYGLIFSWNCFELLQPYQKKKTQGNHLKIMCTKCTHS